MRILCDVDGVVADMLPVWLSRYNADYGDNLTVEKITVWSFHTLVKPECGKDIYHYIDDENLYNDVHPITGALDGVKELRRMGHKFVFLTAGFNIGKIAWLHEHRFLKGKNSNWRHAEDVVVAFDKSLILGDAIIDDRPKNLEDSPSKIKVLFDAPYNLDSSFTRCLNWQEVVKCLSL